MTITKAVELPADSPGVFFRVSLHSQGKILTATAVYRLPDLVL
ncbi:MAG: hypothetical protein ACM3MN_06880 [Nitrospirota bacterium]